jgi:hypothetical protein
MWVAELRISRRTAQKISDLHHVDAADVRNAVVCVSGLQFVWQRHPERGLRALVQAPIGGYKSLVVLYPVTEHPLGDVYRLGTAYRL